MYILKYILCVHLHNNFIKMLLCNLAALSSLRSPVPINLQNEKNRNELTSFAERREVAQQHDQKTSKLINQL